MEKVIQAIEAAYKAAEFEGGGRTFPGTMNPKLDVNLALVPAEGARPAILVVNVFYDGKVACMFQVTDAVLFVGHSRGGARI